MSDFFHTFGWATILTGLLAGAAQGLFFHRADWLGGYSSWRRRLMRLGHVSFVGLGILNLAFASTVARFEAANRGMDGIDEALMYLCAGALLAAGTVLMPVICYSSAWREQFRYLFFLPVGCLVTAVALIVFFGG